MTTKHIVLYLPGLGDEKNNLQEKILNLWNIFGLRVKFHKIGWADGEPFEPKFRRILKEVDELTKNGEKIALIGVSAGASAAINTFSQRKDKISSVVLICGKINQPERIEETYYKKNPGFKGSIQKLQESLKSLKKEDRKKIASIHPIVDFTVAVDDTIIEGAREITIPIFGHIPAIAYAITIGSFKISRIIKNW